MDPKIINILSFLKNILALIAHYKKNKQCSFFSSRLLLRSPPPITQSRCACQESSIGGVCMSMPAEIKKAVEWASSSDCPQLQHWMQITEMIGDEPSRLILVVTFFTIPLRDQLDGIREWQEAQPINRQRSVLTEAETGPLFQLSQSCHRSWHTGVFLLFLPYYLGTNLQFLMNYIYIYIFKQVLNQWQWPFTWTYPYTSDWT